MTDLTAIRLVLRDDEWSDEIEMLITQEILRLSADCAVSVEKASDLAYGFAAVGFGGIGIVTALAAARSWLVTVEPGDDPLPREQ